MRCTAASLVALGLVVVAPPAATAEDTAVATIANASGAAVPAGVVVSPDGARAYVLGPGVGTVSVIDTASNAIVGTISQPNGNSALDISPDGSRLYITDTVADAVLVVDTTANPPAILTSIPVGDGPTGIAVGPDGTRVYVANTNAVVGGTTVSVIDTTTVPPTVTASLAGPTGARGVVFSADGSRVYMAHATALSSSVSIIDTTTSPPTFLPSIPLGANANQLRNMVLSADGTKIYGTRSNTDTVVIIDLATNAVSTIPGGESATGIAVTPDGTRIYVTNTDPITNVDTVSVISTALIGTPAPTPVVDTVEVGNDPRGIAITPDGRYAYVADTTSQTVSVIAIDTFPAITTTTVPNGTVGAAYSTHVDVTGSPTPLLALTAGALPPGLAISPSGDLAGTPTAAGTYNFTLTASSNVSVGIPASVTQQYTIEVAAIVADAPLALTAQLTGDVIDLAWTAPMFDGGTPITSYRIERSVNGGPFADLVADTASTGTTYADPDVQPGATYTYRVHALNAAGQSSASNEAAVVIPPADTTTTTTTATTTQPPATGPSTTQPPTTAPSTTEPPSTSPAPPAPATQPPAPSLVPELPQTGSDSGVLLLLAFAAVLFGGGLLLAARIRKTALSRIR